MSSGAIFERMFVLLGWNPLRSKELPTTDTEENAIANPASSGFKTSQIDASAPAAIGIQRIL